MRFVVARVSQNSSSGGSNSGRPAEDVLEYKAGAQIMLLTNDPADRWVNGTLAKITHTLFDDDGEPYVVSGPGSCGS
jgi:hypothetical protein